MVTLKYNQILNFTFAQTMQKILNTPTHGQKASVIHKIGKKLTKAQAEARKSFQDEVVEKFGKRDAEGNIIRPEGEPGGFDVIEGQEEAFAKAQAEWGEKTLNVDCPFVTLDLISDMKVSAQDLEALAGFYPGNTEEKPALQVAK